MNLSRAHAKPNQFSLDRGIALCRQCYTELLAPEIVSMPDQSYMQASIHRKLARKSQKLGQRVPRKLRTRKVEVNRILGIWMGGRFH